MNERGTFFVKKHFLSLFFFLLLLFFLSCLIFLCRWFRFEWYMYTTFAVAGDGIYKKSFFNTFLKCGNYSLYLKKKKNFFCTQNISVIILKLFSQSSNSLIIFIHILKLDVHYLRTTENNVSQAISFVLKGSQWLVLFRTSNCYCRQQCRLN